MYIDILSITIRDIGKPVRRYETWRFLFRLRLNFAQGNHQVGAPSNLSATNNMATKPPFPPTGGYLQAVRESSRNLRIHANIKVCQPY
jgi:hypothetical protein